MQYTVVNYVKSNMGTCDVSQGSVLDLLLFVVYVNDMSHSVPEEKLKFLLTIRTYIYNCCYIDLEKKAHV